MKFKNLKKPITPIPSFRDNYWTTKRCKQLTQNYNLLDMPALRKMFGGYSTSTIKRKARELRAKGWYFAKKN